MILCRKEVCQHDEAFTATWFKKHNFSCSYGSQNDTESAKYIACRTPVEPMLEMDNLERTSVMSSKLCMKAIN